MTRAAFLSAAAVAAASAFPAEIPLTRMPGGDVRFGGDALSVRISGASGGPASVSLEGEEVLAWDASLPPFDIENGTGAESASGRSFRPEGVSRVDKDAIRSVVSTGDWRVEMFFRLDAAKRSICRSFRLQRLAEGDGKIRAFRFANGRVRLGAGGGYRAMMEFPPRLSGPENLRPGRRTRPRYNPSVAMADTGGTWSVLWTLDDLRPYSDGGDDEIVEEAGAVRVETSFRTRGLVRKGTLLDVGDSWILFARGGTDGVLARMAPWRDGLGMKPPADRPDWAQETIVYCLHPGGPIASNCRGWGGFRNAQRYLPFIRDLGANAVWVMPVEDQYIYCPRDYYRFQEGIGTQEDYRTFTARAHSLGLKVLQDCVPHGGNSDSDRARKHPEWLLRNEDGSVPGYMCFDFGNPQWIGYMCDWARRFAHDYSLDGLRIDAVCGSPQPNWSTDIPYDRAGHSVSQGGLSMERALRRAVRGVNGEALILSEAEDGFHASAADIHYDGPLGGDILPRACEEPAEQFVPELCRWLEDQRLGQIQGALRLRYADCHDWLFAKLRYGGAAQTAAIALTAWIDGVPMIYQEMEDCCFEDIRRIFAIRRAVPELNTVISGYLSAKAPPGVFACVRGGRAVALVNFNGTAVSGEVSVPESVFRDGETATDLATGARSMVVSGKTRFSLPPFGWTVLRCGDCNGMAAPATWPATPGVPCSTGLRCDIALADANGMPVGDSGLSRERAASGALRVSADAPAARIEIRLPGASNWFAHSAEGFFEAPFRVRHPGFAGVEYEIYRLPQGGPCIWDSRLHPMGMGKGCAGGFAGGEAVRVSGFPDDAAVRLLESSGSFTGLVVQVEAGASGRLECSVSRAATNCVRANRAPETGDSRLAPCFGGWTFDNGLLRVRILRNGSLAGVWCRSAGGCVKIAGPASLESTAGFGPAPSYAQENEIETFARFEMLGGGRVRMFFEGEMRGKYRFQRLERNPVAFRTVYEFGDGPEFGFSQCVRLTSAPPGSGGTLRWRLPAASGLEMSAVPSSGEDGIEVDAAGAEKRCVWLDGKSPCRIPAGKWCGFSAVFRTPSADAGMQRGIKSFCGIPPEKVR